MSVNKVRGCCPKCKSKTYDLTVVTWEETFNTVVDGVIIFSGTGLIDPIKAKGECSCGHEWTFKSPHRAANDQ